MGVIDEGVIAVGVIDEGDCNVVVVVAAAAAVVVARHNNQMMIAPPAAGESGDQHLHAAIGTGSSRHPAAGYRCCEQSLEAAAADAGQ